MESSQPRGSARTRDRGEEEAGERPRRARRLLADRGTALPSRSRRGHRLAARSPGLRRRRRLAARDSLSFVRAVLSRDGARIRRILAACRTSSGNVVRTQHVLTASGKSSISRNVGRTRRVFQTMRFGRGAACSVLARQHRARCRRRRLPVLWRPRRHASGPSDRRSFPVVGP